MSIFTAICVLIILGFVWVYNDVFFPNNKFNWKSALIIAGLCAVPYLRVFVALTCVAVFAQHAWIKYTKKPI